MNVLSALSLLVLCLASIFPESAVAQRRRPIPNEQSGSSETGVDSRLAQGADSAAGLDLDQLANMDIKVTSASKKSESLNHAAAAIFVISGEDLLRGGFSSIPEALRMVPGLYVAQEDSHSWIVAARGFSWAFNNKMLVLLDGRLLYQPIFGVVYWDTIDPPMEDIDRIEIIRGPGGTLWGANAVNGVINIITKNAKETKGVSITTSSGVDEINRANVRYGGDFGPDVSYRGFGQALYGDATVDAAGRSQINPWHLNQGGMRLDWQISPKDTFSFDGQGYRGLIDTSELDFTGPTAASPINPQVEILTSGGHILGRWKHNFSDRSNTDVLAYCDWVSRIDILGGDTRNTCDVEVQHNFNFSPRHSIAWGGSILSTTDTPSNLFEVSYSPLTRRDNTHSMFGQYEASVVPDKLRIIGGAKLEHNNYTGFEIQPQIRAVWTPTRASTLWGAVSRAVREPARLNTDTDLKLSEISGGPLPVFVTLLGNRELQSEVLRAHEIGYRYQLRHIFSIDLAAFYNRYNKLIDVGPPGTPIIFSNYIELPVPFVNSGRGQTHGLELSLQIKPAARWRLTTGLTEIRGTASPGTQGVATPRHIVNVQSRFDLTRRFNFDSAYYYADAIPELGIHTLNRIDVGISTREVDGFTFSVWGRNLQSAHHLENNSSAPYFPAGEVRRAIVLRLSWQWKPETAAQK